MFDAFFPGRILGFIHDSDPAKHRAFEYRDITPEKLEELQDKGYGAFFTPNGIGDNRNQNGNLRHGKNIVSLNACFADLDSGEKTSQMERIRKSPIPPSFIVETKKGFHVYWLLKGATVTTESLFLWSRIQDAIIKYFQADRAARDPARLLRLPGTKHLKNPNAPFLVSLHSANDVIYTLEEMELAFPPTSPVHVVLSRKHSPVEMPFIKRILPGERHAALIQTGGRLYAGRAPSEYPAVRETLKAWYALSCVEVKTHWEREVDDFCKWVEARNA